MATSHGSDLALLQSPEDTTHANHATVEPSGQSLCRGLLPQDISVCATDPRARHHRVLPQERAALDRTRAGRQRAFAAGRVAARHAMAALGHRVSAVPMGADRTPIWPAGLTGSLAYSQSCCLAAVARTENIRALGVDVRDMDAGDFTSVSDVCTSREQAWIAAQPSHSHKQLGLLIQSAKTCTRRCQYQLSNVTCGYSAVEIQPDLDSGMFRATFIETVGPIGAGSQLSGRFAMGEGLIISAMKLRNW